MKWSNLDGFMQVVQSRNAGQTEFLQAVYDVMDSLWPFLEKNPEYTHNGLLERLIEPERIVQFRVSWVDDAGNVQVNRAFRVQHSSAIGPYKGGMRFHPSVNLSVLKFLAFEQTFKNALTTLPMGGGKGGSDFDPKNKSEAEVMRFCQALMLELYRHIGADTDVPAGDIGVGAREVGYMAGMKKKLSNSAACVFTGKGLSFGGSLIRPEATGYGLIYFVEEMLSEVNAALDGMTVSVSGSGNVAQYTVEKAMQAGAKVVTLSDSGGVLHVPEGFTPDLLAELMVSKNIRRERLEQFAQAHHLKFLQSASPWHIPVDVALPCATENELTLDDAKELVKNNVRCVAEGANMPSTLEASQYFIRSKVLFAPGKASNAGGVAVSGLEMSQNAARLMWEPSQVDEQLKTIMHNIHKSCQTYGRKSKDFINYVDGANIAGFVKVAEAMHQQGVF